jgi:FlgD Ig-like domain
VALQRVLSTVTLLGLLVATAAAFAITERLKLVKSPVYGTVVSKRLSPVCGCSHAKATISVKLRRGDRLTVTILDRHRDVVRTLVDGGFVPRGAVTFTWNGSNDLGTRLPDGVYQPEIHLAQQHRTILLPNQILLDTHPPAIDEATASRTTISPDGDHRSDSVAIHYKLDTPAHALVYLGSKLLIRSRKHTVEGAVRWYGSVDSVPLEPGTYTLSVGAVDLVGNVTPPSKRRPVVIRVRYIELARDRIVLKRPGVRFGVGVDTDARKYWWKLGGAHGVASGSPLLLHAPRRRGTYTLAVGEGKYTAHAVIVIGGGR